MYKIIILTTVILAWTMLMHSISLDRNMLKNSSPNYLVDLARFIDDTNTTKQVGQELFLRNYSSLVTLMIRDQDDLMQSRIAPGMDIPLTKANGFGLHLLMSQRQELGCGS